MTRTKFFGRVVLALAVASVTACGSDENSNTQSDVGLGLDTPLQWIPPNTLSQGGGTTGDTPLNWIDPNNAVGGGGGVFIVSQDQAYFDLPTLYYDVHHPIMTTTQDMLITNPELNAMAMINSIRQNLNGQGGGGGNNPLGGNGGPNILQLLFSEPLRQSARAHCKHIVSYHASTTAPFTVTDPEGFTFTAGAGLPPHQTVQGRLRFGGVQFTGAIVQDAIAGPVWNNAGNVGREFANRNAGAIADPLMRYQGVGHWRGGANSHQWYWVLLIAANVL